MVPHLLIGKHMDVAKQHPPVTKRSGQIAAWIECTDEGSRVVFRHVAFRPSMMTRGLLQEGMTSFAWSATEVKDRKSKATIESI